MHFACVDFSLSQYSIAAPAERMQYRALLHASVYDFDHCDLASFEHVIRAVKVRSKVALHFAGA